MLVLDEGLWEALGEKQFEPRGQQMANEDQQGPRQSRRSFLNTVLAGGFVGTGVLAAYGTYCYLVPPGAAAAGEREAVEVGAAGELPEGEGRVYAYRDVPAIVIHTQEGFVAFDATCPHLGCLVKWDHERRQILCPCHAGIFDLRGNVLSGPPPRPLTPLHVEVVEGKLMLRSA